MNKYGERDKDLFMDTNESGEVKIKTMFLRFTVYCVFTCKSSSVLPSYPAFGWSCCCCAKAPVIAELPSTATRHTTLSRDTVVVLFCCLAACSSSLVCRRLIIIFHSVCVSLSPSLFLSPPNTRILLPIFSISGHKIILTNMTSAPSVAPSSAPQITI